ncbi:MAG: outer rane beta-barrel protein [Flavisolibacter sp.]|nr:outer rane beta-barrel protein [Flavisolibacter sp.]
MRKLTFIVLILTSQNLFAQFQIGPFLGAGGYLGDLNYTPAKRLKPAIGIAGLYEVSNRINLRGGITFGKLEGGDQWSGTAYLKENRNLSFTSNISEFSLVAEFIPFNLNKINWSPYIFGGIALFHFNPYVKDSGTTVYLKPLSTEGQGLPEYPDRKPYSLTQFSIPFGGGLKYILSDNVMLDLEFGLRKTSTDYLDDVSTNFIDPIFYFSTGVKQQFDFPTEEMRFQVEFLSFQIMVIQQKIHHEGTLSIKIGTTLPASIYFSA